MCAVSDVRQRLHAVEVGRPRARAAAVHDGDAVGHGGRGYDAARRGHVVEDVISCSVVAVVTAASARTAAAAGAAGGAQVEEHAAAPSRVAAADAAEAARAALERRQEVVVDEGAVVVPVAVPWVRRSENLAHFQQKYQLIFNKILGDLKFLG